MFLSDVPTPAFVLNRRTLLRNCDAVLRIETARTNGILKIRPHVKTHKTAEGAYVQAFGRLPPPPPSSSYDGRKGEKQEEEEENRGSGHDLEYPSSAPAPGAQVVGFVASTLPEVSMLLNAASNERFFPPPGASPRTKATTTTNNKNANDANHNPFRDVLYGVPISQERLCRIDGLMADHEGSVVHVLIDHPDQLRMCEEYVAGRRKGGRRTRGRARKERKAREETAVDEGGGEGLGNDKKKEGDDDDNGGMVPYFTAFLKIDTGYHRAGVPPTDYGLDLAAKLMTSRHVKLRGLYSHCGHAYGADDENDLDAIVRDDHRILRRFLDDLVDRMEAMGWGDYARLRVPNLVVSVGSTPSLFHHRRSFSSSDDTEEVGRPQRQQQQPRQRERGGLGTNMEIHPGNYALYDRQQLAVGSCRSVHDIAGTVLATVIGHYPDRNTILLDAGALALSKDGCPALGGTCAVAGWEGGGEQHKLECLSTSQEVTVVGLKKKNRTEKKAEGTKEEEEEGTSSSSSSFPFREFPLGSKVRLLPNHSCLAAACFDRYYVVDEDSAAGGTASASEASAAEAGTRRAKSAEEVKVVDEWIPVRGW